jgi:hypothetical protein
MRLPWQIVIFFLWGMKLMRYWKMLFEGHVKPSLFVSLYSLKDLNWFFWWWRRPLPIVACGNFLFWMLRIYLKKLHPAAKKSVHVQSKLAYEAQKRFSFLTSLIYIPLCVCVWERESLCVCVCVCVCVWTTLRYISYSHHQFGCDRSKEKYLSSFEWIRDWLQKLHETNGKGKKFGIIFKMF